MPINGIGHLWIPGINSGRSSKEHAGLDHPKPRSSRVPSGVAMGVCFPTIHSAAAPAIHASPWHEAGVVVRTSRQSAIEGTTDMWPHAE
jgi:hypothetical protein